MTEITEHCQSEYFEPQCAEDEVIIMEYAQYGRMKINRCVKKDFGYVGCGHDVMRYVDAMCSGRRSCRVRVLDESFKDIQPCQDDLKSYLAANYRCIKG